MKKYLILLLSICFQAGLSSAAEAIAIHASPGSVIRIVSDREEKVITVNPGDQIVLRIGEEQKKECLSAYGTTVCGFNCMSAYGQVKCARDPQAKCLASYGKIECGFDCKAAYGAVACAKASQGTCEAAYGKITCSD